MRFEERFPYLSDTLQGIYSAEHSRTDDEEDSELRSGLKTEEFRKCLKEELEVAMADPGLGWASILWNLEIGRFASDDAAREFIKTRLYDEILSVEANAGMPGASAL